MTQELIPKKEFMQAAIDEAKKAQTQDDYAIGAVIVQNDKIISRAGNQTRRDRDPTCHAEIVVIKEAARILQRPELDDCILYTTHEPCPMCASAAVWARVRGIVSGSSLDDMLAYQRSHATQKWPWRMITLSAKSILEKGDPRVIFIEKFMQKECNELFHS